MQRQPSTPGVYSIGHLSREFNVTTRALRHYEFEGLLQPARQGSKRLFDQKDIRRLKVIMEARKAGLGLPDIRRLLNIYDPRDRGEAQIVMALDLLRRRLVELDEQRDLAAQGIAELEARLDRIPGSVSPNAPDRNE